LNIARDRCRPRRRRKTYYRLGVLVELVLEPAWNLGNASVGDDDIYHTVGVDG
jgi:hypothetical protein